MADIFNEQRVLGVRIVADGTLMHNGMPVIGVREAAAGVLFADNQRVQKVFRLAADQAMYNYQPVRGAVLIRDARLLYNGRVVIPCHGSYEAETLALTARFTTAPTPQRMAAIDAVFQVLKASTILGRLDAFWMIAAADAQAAGLNWIADRYNLTPVGSPTFTADRGYAGNGTSSYVRTNYTPSTDGVNYKLNDASGWFWSRTSTGEDTPLMGNVTSPRLSITPRSASNFMIVRVNDGAADSIANNDGSGLIGGSRSGATTKKAWRNGAQLGATFTTASTGLPAQELYLCGVNTPNYATKQVAFAALGASLDGLEAEFYTAIAAYMTAVGAA